MATKQASVVPEETPSIDLAVLNGLPMLQQTMGDPEAAQRSIVMRMLEAESPEQLLSIHEGKSSDDLVGKRYRVLEVAFGVYHVADRDVDIPLAQVKANDLETGELETWATTATNLVATLIAFTQKGWLPYDFEIAQGTSSSGRDFLFFKRIR